ncbi:MAG: rhodanese domain-containing [Geobacteraceae bacterium]|nr:MAG: rhodanese domain-containing [Geobacteraceae bacterium]
MNIDHIDAVALMAAIHEGDETALIDPREEGVFGQAHLLLAVNVPLSRLELRIGRLVPRKSTRIVLTDDGDGLSERAASKLRELGYGRLEILDGGLSAWRSAGFELFSGMSVPAKAFGEWIAVTCKTPSISAEELHEQLVNGADVLVLDSRPANEYANMTIPGSINVPVSELVYRFGELPVGPETLVVVNCAGRTRSLIGAQTLIDAGVGNRVVALRGGTTAWQLAGFELEHGARRHAPEPWGKSLEEAMERARAVAGRFRVKTIDESTLAAYKAEEESRSLYIIDVRTPDEFRAGHRPDSSHAWGVQLVQSTDRYVGTRNSRIVLVDNYQVRALMTASWLIQAGWSETSVLADPFRGVKLESGNPLPFVPAVTGAELPRIGPAELKELLEAKRAILLDFSDSLSYRRGHIPGAWFAIRSRLAESLDTILDGDRFVATGNDHALASLAARDLAELSGKPAYILEGGNGAWSKAGFAQATGLENLAAKTDDLFRMPFLWGHFEDGAEFEQAAADYLNWELQLPEQLQRSGEINFSRSPRPAAAHDYGS